MGTRLNFNFIVFIFVLFGCNSKKENQQIATISCGQCQFGLTSQEGCDLAVKIDNKAYFVDGAHIDDFGDAHEINKGFCETVRKATISGEIIGNRYKTSSIQLID